jgi:DNA-binding PadR family transcriptional regulator
MLRMTDKEMVIAGKLIARGRPCYGLELVRMAPDELSEKSIYVLLTRMLARGLVKARFETNAEKKLRGPRRRLYEMTGYGEQQYEVRLAADRAGALVEARIRAKKPVGAL